MPRFAVETLDQEERAFVELVEGLHQRIEALKIAFPRGRLHMALVAMQAANACLVAAAVKAGE